ncbi:MAG: amidohydrolase [Clostridia bacterium]|nr:amidohydrolase [Clostridia bacterium]
MLWRELPKIDAHIHILPREVLDANPDAEDEFSHAVWADYRRLMERYHIERAVVMPLNDPWLMSMAFTVEAVHRNLSELCEQSEGRLCCFADVDVRNTAKDSCAQLQRALKNPCFRGIKLHPNNSGMNIDDPYNDAIADCAVGLGCPIAVHAYPASAREQDRGDFCAPARIKAWMKRHPGLRVIVCHLGGFQWEDAVELDAFFDISAILPDLAERFGVREAGDILRRFGAERLLFGTDWPFSRTLRHDEILDRYMDLLDQMAFSEQEMLRIGRKNAEELLLSPSPSGIS